MLLYNRGYTMNPYKGRGYAMNPHMVSEPKVHLVLTVKEAEAYQDMRPWSAAKI